MPTSSTPSAAEKPAHTEWRWQLDPLDESGRVQVANKDGAILAEVASIKSANYITHRLNNHAALCEALEAVLRHAEINTCNHEETYRGGAIWTICSRCGGKWADDEGGFHGFQEPAVFELARAALAAATGEPR